jgi:hypothetical protein
MPILYLLVSSKSNERCSLTQQEAVATVRLGQASPQRSPGASRPLAFISEDILLTGPVTGDLSVR